MADLQARKLISPNSGFSIVVLPHFNAKLKGLVLSDLIREGTDLPRDCAEFADQGKRYYSWPSAWLS